ncbi:MAG TPA: hypothetical protein VHX14_05135, partial [Thermoanaerobaculia bacterium]|nr:hypothetical protein [Thermoanaerobaculia bacterium]
LPTDVRNIQFAFTKAARETAHFDRAYPDAVWVSADRTKTASALFVDDNTSETLMTPGTWDMLIWTMETDPATNKLVAADFIAREKMAVAGDASISLTAADAPHTITFAGRRETGLPLTGNGYLNSGRIVLDTPATGGITSLSFPWTTAPVMHISDLSSQKTMLFYETVLDTTVNDYYMVQHPPLTGVNDDATLSTGGSALRGGTVMIGIPPPIRGDRRLFALATNPAISAGVSAVGIAGTPAVIARVFVSPDVNPAYVNGIAFIVTTDGITQYTTPLLRVIDDKLVSVGGGSVLPWTYSGSTYEYGLGPRFPLSIFVTPAGTPRVSLSTEITGPLGESRITDRVGTSTAIFDAAGNKILNSGYSTSIDFTAPHGKYRIEVANQGMLVPGVSKTTTATMNVDSSQPDYFPPLLTTMMLLDGSGTLVTRLEPHGSGSLLFSAADFIASTSVSGRTYQQIRGDATKAWYRLAGETVWRPLTATQVTEDTVHGAGILYRADLHSITNIDRALVDLKFDLADITGNTTTVTMAPAFSIGPELPPRRQAAH